MQGGDGRGGVMQRNSIGYRIIMSFHNLEPKDFKAYLFVFRNVVPYAQEKYSKSMMKTGKEWNEAGYCTATTAVLN